MIGLIVALVIASIVAAVMALMNKCPDPVSPLLLGIAVLLMVYPK